MLRLKGQAMFAPAAFEKDGNYYRCKSHPPDRPEYGSSNDSKHPGEIRIAVRDFPGKSSSNNSLATGGILFTINLNNFCI